MNSVLLNFATGHDLVRFIIFRLEYRKFYFTEFIFLTLLALFIVGIEFERIDSSHGNSFLVFSRVDVSLV
jgi:hypothetical protein